MDGLQLIYFADPMCSWCYGFSPVVRALRPRYAEVLPIRLIMGGLRPGTRRRCRSRRAAAWCITGTRSEP